MTQVLYHHSRSQARAFTLAELIVALVVGLIVAGATVTTLSSFTRSRARAQARQEAFARADAAAARIAGDVMQTTRESELLFAKVSVTSGGEGSSERDSLLLWVRSLKPVRGRGDVPEGADAEVQFKLLPDSSGKTALWRRADAPPDRAVDAGGVAQAMVRGVSSLKFEASDGFSWFDAWDSDRDGYPHAIRVTTTAQSDDGKVSMTARRVVSIDRVPIPPPAEEEPADEGSAGGAQ
jgi:prepilin-type N-terminal cleavage/methylation domain-containing protein